MIPQLLFGGLMYAASNADAESRTKDENKELLEKMDKKMSESLAIMGGAIVGGLLSIIIQIGDVPKQNELQVKNSTEIVQNYIPQHTHYKK